ncbi:MAG: winged helix-turn-helix domain-containing protein, partial [Isosphaeraceae bacterium]
QSLFYNRVAWAKAHMKMAGLLENPVRGYIRISSVGRELLETLKRCVITSSTHPTGLRPSPAGARPGSTLPLN